MATQVDLILHNAQFVVVADAKASVLRNVSIAIKDEKIFGIVPIDQENQWQSSKVIDCSHHLVMPGLINTHTHTPMTLLRGVAEDVDLQGFLEKYGLKKQELWMKKELISVQSLEH